MITGKCFPLQDDFVLGLCWTVEARHEKVEIASKSAHDCDLILKGSYNRCHQFGASGVHIDKGGKELVFMRDKVPCYAFGCPSSQVLFNVSPCIARLNTQRVTTEVDAFRIGTFNLTY